MPAAAAQRASAAQAARVRPGRASTRRVAHVARQPQPPVRQRGPGLVALAAAETEQLPPSSGAQPAAQHGGLTGPPATQLTGRVAILRATKTAVLDVAEAGRPLAEYMVLPASQYSVLDAKRIERLDEDTFRCYVGGLKLFSLEVEPVITVSVTVQERGPTVRLLSTKLRGSKAVEAANERFAATMTNVVRWQEGPAAGKQLASDTVIEVQLQVPVWFVLPTSAIERTGSAVMGRVLDSAVPRFLQQLAVDYAAWAAGDETRQPVAEGSILDDCYEAPHGLGETEQAWD